MKQYSINKYPCKNASKTYVYEWNDDKKAMAVLFVKTRNYFFNAETLLSLFDTYIGSILNYGCEV